MNQVFLLLVVAIGAITIIGMITGLFEPFLPSGGELTQKSVQAIEGATTRPGKTIGPFNVTINSGSGMTNQPLNTNYRQSGFSCLDELLCCSTTSCKSPLMVLSNRVYANQSTKTTVSARCDPQGPVMGCVIFVGKTPPQIQLTLQDTPSTFNLSSGTTLNVNALIENKGDTTLAEEIVIESLVEKEIIENNLSRFENAKKNETVLKKKLPSGESVLGVASATILSPGNYRITITAKSVDGGFDEKKLLVNVSGTATLCETDFIQNSSDESCPQKAFCKTGCVAAFECAKAWQQKMTNSLFEARTPNFACQTSGS